jgi:outer membrane protein insertion porin family
VEVSKSINPMRFSPVLLAVFTASATLGLTSPVRADSNPTAATQNYPLAVTPDVAPTPSQPESAIPEFSQASPSAAPSDAPSEEAPDAAPSQAPSGVNEPGEPPSGTQTPAQPTENQLQIPLQDSPNPPQLDITPNPSLNPAPETAPELDPTTESPSPTTLPSPAPSEGTPPVGQPADQPGQPPSPTAEEARVLVAEVAVSGAEGELRDQVYQAISTRPGRTTTRSQLQADINAIFETGLFANVRAVPEDTALGVRVTFEVQPNPLLRQVQVQGNQVLPQSVIDTIFSEQYGEILNLNDFQRSIDLLNQWYKDNGYVLAQVVGAPQVAENGTVTLEVAEGVIENIEVRFLNREGEATDENGEPIRGRTREFIITRELETKPGDIFNQSRVQADLQRVYGLGIFDDVRVSLNPGQDPRQVGVVVNVIERNTGQLTAGAGVSSASGLFGTASFQERNLGGNNQTLSADAQVGVRDLLFNLSFTDPWIATDPYRTSYTVSAFGRQSVSLIFDGGRDLVTLDNDDRPRVNRLGGGVSFSRPLDQWLGWQNWRASAGVQYQRVRISDSDGDTVQQDEEGNQLSFSDTGEDDLLLLQLSAVNDRRNSALQPTSGSLLRFSVEQSIPFGSGSILLSRLRANYSYFIPIDLTNFTDGAETLAFNVQAGTVLGDLPPYEAFSLGGTDSVRGYDSGELGSGRSFVQATAEYRFPIFSIVGGALFADFGSDVGTADNVPGQPAVARDKPGVGFGVGVGVRVQSPLGSIRVDFAVNDQGDNQIHFGIGERF